MLRIVLTGMIGAILGFGLCSILVVGSRQTRYEEWYDNQTVRGRRRIDEVGPGPDDW